MARESKVTTSQVSKAMRRLEKQIGIELLERGERLLRFTPEAQALLPHLERIVGELDTLLSPAARVRRLAVAASSPLRELFMAGFLSSLADVRFRLIEMPCAQIRAHVGEGLFHAALLDDITGLPSTWHAVRVGTLRYGLFGSTAATLTPSEVRGLPFVVRSRARGGELLDDGCPLSLRQRKIAVEVDSWQASVAIAASTNNVTFGPAVGVSGVQEITVLGWKVATPLFLAYDIDRLKGREVKKIADALAKTTTA